MSKTSFPNGIVTDNAEINGRLSAESVRVGGAEAAGVVVKTTAPTSETAVVGTLWIKQDATAPEVHVCVAAGTWKKLSFATA